MHKVSSDTFTAGMFNRYFKETMRQYIANDKAYNFMKGTPTYCQKCMHEVIVMVKQLGAPTFFLTLSCAAFKMEWCVLCYIQSNWDRYF